MDEKKGDVKKRGRPVQSQVRQNIIEILYYIKKGYGYDISRIHNAVFPSVSMRNVYYHLKKGVEIGEIKVHKIKKEEGAYSWGNFVEKTYYTLGENASPKGISKIKGYLTRRKKKMNGNGVNPASSLQVQ